jgi:drug/metabolite transporter (DMT)-like permease
MGAVYVATTLLLTVYGQLVIKWQVERSGTMPEELGARVAFLGRLLVNPWVISVWVAAAIAAISWMAAMTRFELRQAYPFMALSFVLVPVCAAVLLGERLTPWTMIGAVLIVAGLVVATQ